MSITKLIGIVVAPLSVMFRFKKRSVHACRDQAIPKSMIDGDNSCSNADDCLSPAR
jgi:hypothetical protein